MQAQERPDWAKSEKDHRSSPPAVRLEETIASIESDRVPDPEARRNVDQHRALRGDWPVFLPRGAGGRAG